MDSVSSPSSCLGDVSNGVLAGAPDWLLAGRLPGVESSTPYPTHPSRSVQIVHEAATRIEPPVWHTIFEQFGEIRDLFFPEAGAAAGAAVVSFFDLRDARACYRAFHGALLRSGPGTTVAPADTRFVIPQRTTASGDDLSHQGTLVVFNLDPATTVDSLRSVFSRCGEVKEVRETPHKKHHKFVEFFDVRSAQAAMSRLNKTDIGGKRIKIEASRPGGARRGMVVGDGPAYMPRRSSLTPRSSARPAVRPFVCTAPSATSLPTVGALNSHRTSPATTAPSSLSMAGPAAAAHTSGLPHQGPSPLFAGPGGLGGVLGDTPMPTATNTTDTVSPLTAAVALPPAAPLGLPSMEGGSVTAGSVLDFGSIVPNSTPALTILPSAPAAATPGVFTTVMIDAPAGMSVSVVVDVLASLGFAGCVDLLVVTGAAAAAVAATASADAPVAAPTAASCPVFINFISSASAAAFMSSHLLVSWMTALADVAFVAPTGAPPPAPRPAPVQGADLLAMMYPPPLSADPRECGAGGAGVLIGHGGGPFIRALSPAGSSGAAFGTPVASSLPRMSGFSLNAMDFGGFDDECVPGLE